MGKKKSRTPSAQAQVVETKQKFSGSLEDFFCSICIYFTPFPFLILFLYLFFFCCPLHGLHFFWCSAFWPEGGMAEAPATPLFSLILAEFKPCVSANDN
jgi:hypothetical protein